MDSDSHQQLLDVTHQELIVIQGNTTEGRQGKQEAQDVIQPLVYTPVRGLMISFMAQRLKMKPHELIEVFE